MAIKFIYILTSVYFAMYDVCGLQQCDLLSESMCGTLLLYIYIKGKIIFLFRPQTVEKLVKFINSQWSQLELKV